MKYKLLTIALNTINWVSYLYATSELYKNIDMTLINIYLILFSLI